MENKETFQMTLSASDWHLIRDALLVVSAEKLSKAYKIGAESIYGSVLIDEGWKLKALAEDITFSGQ